MVCSDIEDLLIPVPSSLLLNLVDNRQAVDSFLRALPASFAGDSTRLCALLFEPDGRYTGNYRLEVYEDGALSCRQRLSGAHPENSRYASKDTRVYMDGESLGLSRFGSN